MYLLMSRTFVGRHVAQPRSLAFRCLRPAASSAERQQAPPAAATPAQQSSNDNGGGQPKGKKGPKGQKAAAAEGSSIEQLRALRISKADKLRESGLNPFAYKFERTACAAELQTQYASLENGEEAPEDVQVSIAGRVMTRRVMGKLAFVTLRDDSGTIQLYVDKSRLEDAAEGFSRLKNLIDAGDIIGVSGGLRRTEKGELSVVAKSIQVLTKSMLPLPDKWHGLQDVEKRYRQRYVDLIVNPEVKATFLARSRIVSTIRRALEDDGFCEVETPVLENVAGGADARPFRTYHNTLKRNFTMRIATELHLKRLVVGGFEKVFEIGRIFRNEGISTRHNPEFTSIEVYQAYADYQDMMRLTENLIRACVKCVLGVPAQGEASLIVQYGEDLEIDFAKDFRRASMYDLVQEVTGTDFWELRNDLPALKTRAQEALERGDTSAKDRAALAECGSAGRIVNHLFEALVEPTLQQPTFVTDHPVEISPLAKPHPVKEGLTQRFELFVAGRELANSFSELTDPIEQRKRFEQQVRDHRAARAAMEASGKDSDPEMDYDIEVDHDFITALEYGMPPTAGMGMGIDRLVMLLTNSPSIRDVIAFPAMK